MTNTDPDLTLAVARAYHGLAYDDLPAAAVDAAKISLADGLACMMAARGEGAVAGPRAYAARDRGVATLFGTSSRCGAGAAALGNGALAHAADFEDTFEAGMIHPNASVIPAVLALAEETGASGADVLAALVIGCDAACRLSLVMGTKAAARGWYHPPMITAVGAALACARLLRLSPEGMVNAVGLTLCQFSLGEGLIVTPQSHLRAMREGLAARAAVEGARLAEAGVIATREPFFGHGGLAHLLLGEIPDTSAMLAAIATHFYGPEVGIKIWPSCRGTHGAIGIALDLRARGIAAGDIARVDLMVAPVNKMLFEPVAQKQAPQSPIEGKFSIPYCFAHTLHHGEPGLAAFQSDALRDPATLALAAKVHRREGDPQAEVDAEIILADGQRLALTYTPKVWRVADIRMADLATKIANCAAACSPAFDAMALADAVEHLDRDGLAPLMRVLGGDATQP